MVTRGSLMAKKQGGQAAVEFALVLTVAMIVLFVAVQLALIGQAALALGQMNYQGARWAAVNPCATASDIATYMVSVGSPTITKNCGANLSISVDSIAGSPTCPVPSPLPSPPGTCASPRAFSTPVVVQVHYSVTSSDKGGVLVLPQNFLGIPFPTTLNSTETAMSE